MALANYTDLQTAVANFLRRSDLTAIIPDLITLAEVRINGDIDARLQDTKTTLTATASQAWIDMPSDVINIRHLSIENSPTSTLDYLTPDQFETSWPYSTMTGVPAAYTVIGSKIYLAPVPDSAYSVDIIYKAKVPNLAAAGTTWLMTNYPHVYLFATLCEAAPYIKDDSRVSLWESKYNESIDTVNQQDWYSGSTMRVRSDVRP